MNECTDAVCMPDVQSSKDTRQIAIDKVGIKSIRHPVKVADKAEGVQHTIASFNMYVYLPQHFKGTHMSRFVEILNTREREISVENFESMLRHMVERLEAESGHIEMSFPYFINKAAPVSGVNSLMDYEVTLIGEIDKGEYRHTTKVVVPVTSLCPCSKKISEYGAHNQRSHVTVTARTNGFLWIEDDRARLRQPQVRRRHRARRRRRHERRAADRRVHRGGGEFREHPQSFGLRAHRAGQGQAVTVPGRPRQKKAGVPAFFHPGLGTAQPTGTIAAQLRPPCLA